MLYVALQYLRARFGSERGASLVEYTLLVALIAAFCIVAIGVVGQGANDTLNYTGGEIAEVVPEEVP